MVEGSWSFGSRLLVVAEGDRAVAALGGEL